MGLLLLSKLFPSISMLPTPSVCRDLGIIAGSLAGISPNCFIYAEELSVLLAVLLLVPVETGAAAVVD